MVRIAIAFVCGILAAASSVVLAALAVLVAVIVSVRRTASARSTRVAYGIIVVAACAGFLDARISESTSADVTADTHMATYHATVFESRAFDATQAALTVRLDDGSQATFVDRETTTPIGERLTLRAKREAFDVARNDGETSEREIEAERGVTWRLVHVRVVARAPPDERDTSLWIARARAWCSQRLHALIGEPDATILAGAMWGERGALPPDLRAEFQDTGTVHVLVTAGLHLGVVAALVLGALSLLGVGRIAESLATVPVVWLYAELSGAHLPSVRAATMLTFALIARASGREAFSWNGLALAAICVAAFHPQGVPSLSFALSFSCVAAIFALARPFAGVLERCGAGYGVAQLLAVALATQCGTWPLTAYGFLVIAPYAPLANAAVVPVVGIAMLVGFAALAAAPVHVLAQGIADVDITLVDWIAANVRFFSHLPGAHIVATPPPVWAIVAYDTALGAFALAIARRRFVTHAAALAAGTAAMCLWPPHAVPRGLTITAIDVGQADSLLIQTPAGHAYLVDGGGRLEHGAPRGAVSNAENIGERVVVPFLIRHGIHHLDAILLSHPHGDHAGGFAPVLRTLGASEFADSGQMYAGHAYLDAIDVARERSVAMLEPRAGTVWHTDDGVTFRFYGPALPYISGSRNDINENSLVFRLEYARFAMLFTGDAGARTEQRLLASSDDLHADVLKVGHHGSAYGSTPAFIDAVAPKFAIISVGAHNLFGHPSAQTIETLNKRNIAVLRTDRNGEIIIRSDGSTTNVSAFL